MATAIRALKARVGGLTGLDTGTSRATGMKFDIIKILKLVFVIQIGQAVAFKAIEWNI